MTEFEIVPTTAEVTIEKYQLPSIEEQFNPACVVTRKIDIFTDQIWQGKGLSLNIYEKFHEFIVTDESNENCGCLTSNEFEEFQRLYANNVHKLSLKNIVLHLENYGGLDDVIHRRMLRKNVLNLGHFRNLKSLTYHFMGIPSDHLELIAELNPNLEELCLVNCSLDISMDDLMRDVIVKMKQLKLLCIENMERFDITYGRFQEIITMEKLERLQLTATIMPDECVARSNDQSLTVSGNLKELNIQLTINPSKWPNNLPQYLKCFENLSSLTIETVESLDDNTLAVIARACKNLETFNINSSHFGSIETFPIAPTVTDLSLNSCRGLTCDNLRHLLTQYKIKSFHSIETTYDGYFEGSRISHHLRSLRVDGIPTERFTFPQRNNNLQELSWHNGRPNFLGRINVSSLLQCQQLKRLVIQNGNMPFETLLKLKSLSSLSMPQPLTTYNWRYVMDLLSHPTLKELSFTDTPINSYSEFDLNVPLRGVPTNIKSINIPFDVFEFGLDFWLDLLNRNEELKRICCHYEPHDMLDTFLANLIYHPHFPKSVQSIVINGFTIDCNDFRLNFPATFNMLQAQVDSSRCWHDIELYRIILQK